MSEHPKRSSLKTRNPLNIDENRKEKKEKFAEKRKQSIKNEFTLVKEMMKNKIDEIEDDDEIKINTEKNSKLNEKETDSESEKI